MRALLQAVLGHFPRRRRRLWRYVSPRRHGAGVFVLALLLVATYTYWALTNDVRIRREAERYLSSLTGMRVRIGEAEFSLFGPVRLRNVRVYMEGALSRHPFFRADTVMLRHGPWSLLTRGKVLPYEIVCTDCVVTFEQDESGQDRGREKLMSIAVDSRKRRSDALRGPHPEIRLRRVRWRTVSVGPGRTERGTASADMPVSLSMIPEGRRRYVIKFAEPPDGGGKPTHGRIVLDLQTGRWHMSGYAPSLPRLRPLLPAKYRKWLRKYAINAGFSIRGDIEKGLRVDLESLSMALPQAEGGVKLVDVTGSIVFHERRVELKKIVGRPEQAPHTRLVVTGEYLGYQPTSDFWMELLVDELRFPSDLSASGELGRAIDWLQQEYSPAGTVNLWIRYERVGGGPIRVSGWCEPMEPDETGRAEGFCGQYKWFRYPVEKVKGTILFTPEIARLANADPSRALCLLPAPPLAVTGEVTGEPQLDALVDLACKRGDSRFAIRGWVQTKGRGHDITVRATAGRFDPALRRALPERFGRVWEAVGPRGTAGAKVHVMWMYPRPHDRVEFEMTLDGKAAMVYRYFPYPLGEIVGHIRVEGDTLHVNRLVGKRGPMRATISGTIDHLGSAKPGVDLFIEATDVPLDDVLLKAVGGQAREALASLRASGRAERASVRIHQDPGQPLEYEIRARLRDVGLSPKAFPYAVAEAQGTVTITQEDIQIERLVGVHVDAEGRRSPVTVKGTARLRKEGMALELNVTGRRVAFDQTLKAALPPHAKEVWDALLPSGVADVSLHLAHGLPGREGKDNWQLTINAQGMSVRQRSFPYPFGRITGKVTVTPELVKLDEVTSRSGKMWTQVSGEIRPRKSGNRVELSVAARNVPIDKTLLEALPAELAPLVKRVKPGGTADADFTKLAFIYRRPAAEGESAGGKGGAADAHERAAPGDEAAGGEGAQPRSAPESRPTTSPAAAPWSVAGKLVLHGVTADLVAGYKELSGSVAGSAEMTPQGLRLGADVEFESIALGPRKLTDVRGKLTKEPKAALIRVKDLRAHVHGGRMAGFARAKTTEPMEYGLSIYVQDVDLSALLNAGIKDPKKRIDARGRLTGDLKLLGTSDRPASKRGIGSFRITGAKLYKLPVLLGALQVILLSLPGESAFTEGYVTYRIRGEKLIFSEIHLTGSALSIIGSGTMDMGSERLRLTFLTGRPGKLPRMRSLADKLLGLADELIRVLLKEIVEIEITGTLKHPVTRTVPLRSLKDVVDRLTNPEQETD